MKDLDASLWWSSDQWGEDQSHSDESHPAKNPPLTSKEKENGVVFFDSDWFLMSNLLLGCKRQLLHKKYTHVVYDFWTMFSQKKISPIHCRQKTDGFESRAHTLCNPPLGLCYHGGDLRVTALKDQNTERPTLL